MNSFIEVLRCNRCKKEKEKKEFINSMVCLMCHNKHIIISKLESVKCKIKEDKLDKLTIKNEMREIYRLVNEL